MKARKRIWIVLLISLFILIAEILLVARGLSSGHTIKQVNDTSRKAGYFSAFTVDCEVFMALISFVGIFVCARALMKHQDHLPKWFDVLYMVGTASLFLVFLVVACYLAPIKASKGYGYFYLFKHGNFYNHFLNPWLAIVCFDCINNMQKISHKSAWFAPIPILIYAFVYGYKVVFAKTWPDLYSFFAGDRYWLFPIELIVIFVITYALGRLHIKLHNHNCK